MKTDKVFEKLGGFDKPNDLLDLLVLRASICATREVYHFIPGDNKPTECLTYGELLERASALGAVLQAMNAKGARVILLCPPGLQYMVGYWGCLFAGAIAVPGYPPAIGRLDKTLPRIEAIMQDCEPSIALASSDLVNIAEQLSQKSAHFRNIDWIDLDAVDLAHAKAWVRPSIKPDDIAFLQYTSGSTSSPKGVMVSHANLIHNSRAIFRTNEGSNHIVSWLPPYHDMGLIGTIIQVVYGAGWGYFMAPTTFLRYPALWLQTISETKATVSVAPNFGYEHCVNKITDEQLEQLDLRCWKHAYSGAEPVRAATLDAFSERFAVVGFDYGSFQPSYGLAEVTLQVSGGRPKKGARRLVLNPRDLEARKAILVADTNTLGVQSVACGYPVDDTEIAIVDPETCKRLDSNGVGEIWINSPSVATGYWNRADATETTFHAKIIAEPGKLYLRTGDLGFIDDEGELHITGRIKDLIVLRGRNLYPNDIESVAQQAYPGHRGKVVAFSIDVDGREELVVIMEGSSTDEAHAASLVASTRRLLADAPLELTPYGILVVRSGSIPQTSSGKLQRHSARSQFLELELKPIFASILSNENRAEPEMATSVDLETWLDHKLPARAHSLAKKSVLSDLGINFHGLVDLMQELEFTFGKSISLSQMLMEPSLENLLQLARGNNLLNESFSIAPEKIQPVLGSIEIEQWLIKKLSVQLDLPASLIDLDVPFASLGLDSKGSVELAQSLSDLIGVPIPETLVWEAPTLRAATVYLLKLQSQHSGVHSYDAPALESTEEAIAIIGIGCRFPSAADLESFWSLLVDGRDAVSITPPNRWPGYVTRTTKTGRPVSEWGAFLDQISGFEPSFFGLSNREAQRMDPQQRLLLEISWEALEHAGINPHTLAGSNTGVFVAIGNQEYWSLQTNNPQDLDIHSCTGNSQAVAANRISYLLDLRGPSMAIDTACSGSLVGVHLACESLRRGESTLAVAGGVNLMIKPDLTIAFSEAQMLSAKGRCSTFDESADGYVRGEGGGLVVLKRLSDAIRDNDPIVAVINGSAVLHDGRSNGLTAPNPQAQNAVINRALGISGLTATDIDYVEAHGTGTPLGDPIEAGVLAAIYGKQRPANSPCFIGSVKTNIGHLEAAAGIAGLIKAALSLEREFIPAHLHFSTPNSKMDWRNSGLKVVDKGRIWERSEDKPLHAAVSSFGFGGTVAHVVLSSAPRVIGTTANQFEVESTDDWQLLVMSAREKSSLIQQIANFHQHITAHEKNLANICYTAATGRVSFDNRVAVVGRNTAEILNALEHQYEQVKDLAPATQTLGKTVFCFSGQGSQYLHMAADLIVNEPVFSQIIERCDAIIGSSLGHSLFDLLGPNSSLEFLQDTRVLQPTLYALEVALAELWKSWGITPDIVLGHSLGEYAAMQVAGIVSLEDGLRLVDSRARAMSLQPLGGGMAACLGDLSALDKILKNYEGRVWTAAFNAPNNRVIAGYQDALDELAACAYPGMTVKSLLVSNAFHSPLIEGAGEELRAFAATVCFNPPQLTCITNLSGKSLDAAPTPDHFSQHLCEAVDFQASVSTALSLGGRTFVEIGPGRTLLNFSRLQAGVLQQAVHCLPSLLDGKPNRKILLESLAQFWMLGGQINWTQFYKPTQRKSVHMPSYPFTRTEHWHETTQHSSIPRTQESTPMTANDNRETTSASSNNVVGASVIGAALELFRSQTAVLQTLTGTNSVQQAIVNAPLMAIGQYASSIPVSNNQGGYAQGTYTQATYAQVTQQLQQYLAKIVGCSVATIALNNRLGTHLGLDSLMRTELDRLMLAQWPQLAQIDRTTLGDDPSVEDVVALVTSTLGIVEAVQPTKSTDSGLLHQHDVARKVIPETNFEESEAYLKNMARMDLINAVGANPYGRIHSGFNGAHATLNGIDVLNFASFNYSSLSNHPEVCAAAKAAIDTYGTSPSATPLLFGETPLHHELEAEIASYLGTEAAVVFASGHSTSVAVIGHIMEPEDLIIHDQYIHDCAIRGAILSGAKRRSFAHDNWAELDQILTQVRGNYRRVLIIIEGVYSQDGDIANLPAFIKIKKKHQCMLMIDEAHSIGVLGKTGAGIGEYYNVDRKDVDIWMGTLSKGLGSCGGYIAASKNFVKFLKYTTPLLIFSTGITPANAAAALQSIRVLRKEPERVQRLQEKCKWFLARAKELKFNTGPSFDSSIVPIIVGSWERAMVLSNMLTANNINVMPIGYPAVEKDKCRLRFFVNIDHKEEELEFALQCLKQAMQNFGEDASAVKSGNELTNS